MILSRWLPSGMLPTTLHNCCTLVVLYVTQLVFERKLLDVVSTWQGRRIKLAVARGLQSARFSSFLDWRSRNWSNVHDKKPINDRQRPDMHIHDNCPCEAIKKLQNSTVTVNENISQHLPSTFSHIYWMLYKLVAKWYLMAHALLISRSMECFTIFWMEKNGFNVDESDRLLHQFFTPFRWKIAQPKANHKICLENNKKMFLIRRSTYRPNFLLIAPILTASVCRKIKIPANL